MLNILSGRLCQSGDVTEYGVLQCSAAQSQPKNAFFKHSTCRKKETKENIAKSIIARPRSIYQYSSMAPRLSGQTSIAVVVFFVFTLLRIGGQKGA